MQSRHNTIDFETGIQTSALSGKYLYFQETYDDFGSDDELLVDDQRGFSIIAEKLADSINDTNNRFILNKTVTEVKYSENGVTVTVRDGTVYSADYAIVTVSLGVLQHRLVTFSPTLPEWKQLAIDKFGIAEYAHIYVKYQTSFWDDTMYLLYTPRTRAKLSIWLNFNAIVPNSNILHISLFSEFARWAAHSSDDEILVEIMATLQKMYPNHVVPPPVDYQISRWDFDPLFMGTFSYWTAGFSETDMKNLGKNVGRVYFAGEHTHQLHYGFVHGALLTGERAADNLMKCIEGSSTCVGTAVSDGASGPPGVCGPRLYLFCIVTIIHSMFSRSILLR